MRIQTISLRRGAFGQPSVPFLLARRAHLLTTAPRGGGGIPPVGRAVRSSRSIHRMFLQRGQTMPPSLWAPVIIACASGRQLSPCLPLRCKPLSSAGTTCHPPAKTCHSTRHALRVRQLYRSYGRCIPSTVHFLLSRQKKQNRPLQGAERK